MDDFQRLRQRAYVIHLFSYLISIGVGIGIWFAIRKSAATDTTAFITAVAGILLSQVIILGIINFLVLQPLGTLWQVILYVSSDSADLSAPDLKDVRFGHNMVVSLANRVYQFAGTVSDDAESERRKSLLQAINIVKLFPQPLFVFNSEQVVTNASTSAIDYIGVESGQLFGNKLFDNVNLDFPSSDTLEGWINDCQANKVTEYKYWRQVRLKPQAGSSAKQCDIAAYYNRDSPSGTEFIVTLFDRTDEYTKDDDSLGFIALAVHELRTPLTMLHGYIEVFEEEMEGKLDDELTGYLKKLRISADQLSAFVTNVLNVVKIDNNQLSLRLSDMEYDALLRQSTVNAAARTRLLGKTLTFKLAENLPNVAADPVSIGEVINNLLDNALKYSNESNEIIISAKLNQEGMVETTVQDFGVGIPANIMPNIFDRFYRNHRTRGQFSGTGLGLYLAKAIITAHGGNIWVRSKPGAGSSFSFTLQTYASLADELKNSDNKDIVRQAHGWIKNHSMYRR